MDRGLLRRIQAVIENDRLFLFTALDLQLNAEVTHQIDVEGAAMEDELCVSRVYPHTVLPRLPVKQS